jgi:hypothetical protein
MLTDALGNTITLNFVNGSVAAADFVFALNDIGTEYSVVDYTGTSAEVIIPDVYMGLPVTKIEPYAFENCTSLTSITIPHSITDISSCAFLGCTSLTSITVALENDKYHSAGNCLIETESKMLILGCKTGIIPTDGSVTSIGDFAFAYCEGLTSITIPDSVASIGKDAFMQCVNLETIAGYSGSAAEAYAQEHNITFVSLDEPQGIPGDIDANGEVTVKDAVLLFRYVAEWDVEVDEDALDVTGDGEVTVKDAVLLFRYIAEWDVEIYRGQR